MLPKQELLARLAAGATVLTPNRRLAQALMREFDDHQIRRGLAVWDAPDILPFGAFVERLYQDAFYSAGGAAMPSLLSAAQEERVWRQIVEKAGLLATDEAAAGCREAWRLMHLWRVRPGTGSEDAAAFASWAESYGKRTADEMDSARLPDFAATLLSQARLPSPAPKSLVAYAFDIVPPQLEEFLEACVKAGIEVERCAPEPAPGRAVRLSFKSAKEELERAASWARARLEQGRQRIGVVVPELELRRREVARVFSRVMRPGFQVPGAAPAALPFNISIGIPLVQYPLVALALSVLEFSQRDIPFEEASRLIRSPFLADGEREAAERAKLDVRLRRRLPGRVSLPKLIAEAQGAPLLRQALEKLFAARPGEDLFQDRSASGWARQFTALLAAAGFPGERVLDSAEFQTRAKLNEALGEMARLERVAGELSPGQALAALRRLCSETLFQPESGEVPVQVLGILESAGMSFDCLWVSGLTDEAWPLRAHANPFLPIARQKQAGIPQASAEGSLALDRRLTAQWLGAAAEVVVSSYEKDGDRELAPSPLILGIAAGGVEVPAFPRMRDALFAGRRAETLEDRAAPPAAPGPVRGGTKVLADQAACPFRAFAHWRLRAEEMATPAEVPDAGERGSLIHKLMAALWSELKTSAALDQDLAPAIERAAAQAVREMELEGRFAELERARLARVAAEWFETVEKARPPFEVVAIEREAVIRLAGLEFKGRIDRMDRTAGGHVLIDYKTGGNPTPAKWRPPRPDEPQLPLYAVSAEEEIVAVAFGKVVHGDMKFNGHARDDRVLPNVKKQGNWGQLLAEWKKEAEALGGAFAAGEARVDPKKELQTCRYCDLQTLCRVYEKVNPLRLDEIEGADE
ncbi:MAG TPA: PD-(D/E)XK nuclease family protein [Burkholderiales bacterium]